MFPVDGVTSIFRHFLSCFCRKTKWYVKKLSHVAIFGHAFEGTVERQARIYLELTIPKFIS